MRILTRYVFDLFLTAFLLSFFVISVVITVGLLTPIVGYFIKGVGLQYLMRLVVGGWHEMLQLTLPLSFFVAALLTFARLASDGEIDALRTCGISCVRVVAGPLVFAALVSVALLWANAVLMPREHERRRLLKSELLLTSGFKMVEPGETVTDIRSLRLKFDGRDGEALLGMTARDYGDPKVVRALTAERAQMTVERKNVYLQLTNMTLDPLDSEGRYSIRAGRFSYLLKNAFSFFRYERRDKDMTSGDLLAYANACEATHLTDAVSARTEFGRRIVF